MPLKRAKMNVILTYTHILPAFVFAVLGSQNDIFSSMEITLNNENIDPDMCIIIEFGVK